MQRTSAAMIVRNEADRLKACLDALNGVVDEVVIADTGSSDGSKEIAAAAGARCFDFPWCDDFAAARNAVLDQVAHGWVLVVDADEVVRNREEAGHRLRDFIDEHDRGTLGTVEIVSPTAPGPDAPSVVDHTLRFFHKEAVRYVGRIHEQPEPSTASVRAASTGVVLDHSGYALPQTARQRKARRNLALLEQMLAEQPDDEYCLFQVGKAQQALAQHGAAATAFQRGLASIHFPPDGSPTGRLGPVGRSVLTGLVVNLAYALVNTERFAEAARLLEEHAALGHAGVVSADFEHVRGYVYLMLGDVARSRAAYEASMRLGATHEDVLGTGSYASAYHLGLLDEIEKDLIGAYNHYLLSLSFRPDYWQTLTRCIDLVVEAGVVLPEALAYAADPDTLAHVYRNRLEHFLADGNMAAVTRLAHGVTACPALLQVCRDTLNDHA